MILAASSSQKPWSHSTLVREMLALFFFTKVYSLCMFLDISPCKTLPILADIFCLMSQAFCLKGPTSVRKSTRVTTLKTSINNG